MLVHWNGLTTLVIGAGLVQPMTFLAQTQISGVMDFLGYL